MIELEQFGQRLEEQLSTKQTTRRAAAELVHCTGATIGRWVRGEGPFSILVLAELHRKFGIDLNELICGEERSTSERRT